MSAPSGVSGATAAGAPAVSAGRPGQRPAVSAARGRGRGRRAVPSRRPHRSRRDVVHRCSWGPWCFGRMVALAGIRRRGRRARASGGPVATARCLAQVSRERAFCRPCGPAGRFHADIRTPFPEGACNPVERSVFGNI